MTKENGLQWCRIHDQAWDYEVGPEEKHCDGSIWTWLMCSECPKEVKA